MTYSIVIHNTSNQTYPKYRAELLPTNITANGQTPYEAVEHILNVAKIELASLQKINNLHELEGMDILSREKELLENFYNGSIP